MSIRLRGLLIMLGSGAASGLLYLVLSWLVSGATGRVSVPKAFALPLVGVVVGLLELVSGVPFTKVASRWDTLPPSLRAVLSFFFVIIAIVVIFGGGIWYLNWKATPR